MIENLALQPAKQKRRGRKARQRIAGQGAAIFCLGTYTGSVSDAEVRTITVDYTVEFALVIFSLPIPQRVAHAEERAWGPRRVRQYLIAQRACGREIQQRA